MIWYGKHVNHRNFFTNCFWLKFNSISSAISFRVIMFYSKCVVNRINTTQHNSRNGEDDEAGKIPTNPDFLKISIPNTCYNHDGHKDVLLSDHKAKQDAIVLFSWRSFIVCLFSWLYVTDFVFWQQKILMGTIYWKEARLIAEGRLKSG